MTVKIKDLKEGQKIILIKSKNGVPQYEGKVGEVIKVYTNPIRASICDLESGATYSIYQRGPTDEFDLASRKLLAECLEKKNAELLEQIKNNEAEIKRLNKFKDDEAEAADKLHKIIQHKDDPEAIAEVLRTLKESNYL